MSNVVWLACHSTTPLDGRRLERSFAAIERALPQLLSSLSPSSVRRRHIALRAWADLAHPPVTWDQVEISETGLGVSDGFPVGFDRLQLGSPAPLAIAAALRDDFTRIDQLHPPYANVALDDGGLSVGIDALGSAKVYRASAHGLTVWSNWASVASLFAFGRMDLSRHGWTTYLSHDRFMADLTALDHVALEQPRTIVRARDRPDGLHVIRTDHVTPLFGPHWTVPDVPAAIGAALDRFYQSLAALRMDSVRIPLSGGRDSRCLAAVALRRNQVDEFYTSVPPELDFEIAGQLIERLDRDIPWRHQNKGAGVRRIDDAARASGVTTADIWQRLLDYQGYADGDGDTRHTRGALSPARFAKVSLWGIGGGFGRAFYYDEAGALVPEERTRQFWLDLRRGDPLVDEAARREALPPRIDALREELDAHGVRDLKQLDYFEIFERVRRTKNRVGTVSGMRPYLAPDFIRPSVTQTPLERVHTRYYEHVVAQNYPRWVDVPFSHELKAAHPTAATAESHAVAFWESPYVQELGEMLMDRVRQQDLVVPDRAPEYLRRPATIDKWAVKRMRTFERLLNYFTYETYADIAGREYRAADGPVGGGRDAAGPTVGRPASGTGVPASTGVPPRTSVPASTGTGRPRRTRLAIVRGLRRLRGGLARRLR